MARHRQALDHGGQRRERAQIPAPRRWRPFHEVPAQSGDREEGAPPSEPNTTGPSEERAEALRRRLRAHVNNESLANYISNQIRTCYFVLRAVGDTGLEGFLDAFFDWVRDELDFDATCFLPEIYRRSMADIDMMRPLFTEVYDRHLRERAEQKLADLDDAQLDEALERAVAALHACKFNDVPPGNYDFGGFVFDQLLGMRYPVAEFAFKIHRLT